MNDTTSSRRRRYSVRAAAVAAASAVILGAAACGTETASDDGKPAAPAGANIQQAPFRTSADAQERRAYAEQQAMYERHYLGSSTSADERRQPVKSDRASSMKAPNGRVIPLS
jgi:hypothetical protein